MNHRRQNKQDYPYNDTARKGVEKDAANKERRREDRREEQI